MMRLTRFTPRVLFLTAVAAAAVVTFWAQTLTGPQASITCPAGAINVFPGTSIQTVLNASATGATVCVRAGVFSPTAPLRPRTGQTLVGEYGAIIEGANVVQAYDVVGTAIISGWNCDGTCDNVTVRNLVVRNTGSYPYMCIGAYGAPRHATGWHVDHVDVSGCWQGVTLDTNAYAGYNYIHDTGKGIGLPELQPWGAGYGGYVASNQVWEYNELARNYGDSKWTNGTNITFRHNYVHDQNVGAWWDGNGTGNLVEDNRFEDLTNEAVMNEISGSLIVRRNSIKRAGTAVFISTSRDTQVYENDLEDNWRNLELYLNCAAKLEVAQQWFPWDLTNNLIHHNRIVMTRNVRVDPVLGGPLLNGLGGFVSCTTAEQQPYLNPVTKGNLFESNTYTLYDPSVSWWFWGFTGLKNWSSWQAVPQDALGTIGTAPSPGPEPSPTPAPPPPPLDTLAPTVTLKVTRSGKSSNYTALTTATDNVGVVTFALALDNQVFANQPGSYTVKITAAGSHTFKATATDAAGLSSFTTASVTR